MKQVYNPFLPTNVYIPDGEPHVFGDRVYLFGSHDEENADTYCALGYEIFSAPVNDLTDWSSKGINYRADQDPLASKTNRHYLYAPDCVVGNDGRYYLYYCLSGERGVGGYHGPISVAVCDTPDGKYEFYGHVKNEDGTIYSENVLFDPAVINDNGVIRLYYGTFYPFATLPKFMRKKMRRTESQMFGKTEEEILLEGDDIMGPYHVVLKEDMLTVSGKATRIFPVHDKDSMFFSKMTLIPSNGHKWVGHGFFEGPSIRKIEDTYYFIYSSMMNHELCYATSKYPDREYLYGGTIVSNGDVGFEGRREKDRLNFTATNHGSIECINGQWYVFYHRQTHGSDYSRQACAEKIFIKEDGSIDQVQITSCGLNNGPLSGVGTYPAVICCNLTNGHMPHGSNSRQYGFPMVYSEDGYRFVKGMTKNTIASYKYFDLSKTGNITIQLRGKGILQVKSDNNIVGTISVDSDSWTDYTCNLTGGEKSVLSVAVKSGCIDMLEFTLK